MKIYLRDLLVLFRSFTFLRLWNSFLLRLSYQLSRLLRRPLHWGMPESLSIEPTTMCNLSCPECPSGLKQFSRPRGMLNTEGFRKMMDEVHQRLIYLILYFQGEPYLNPHFFEMVRYAVSKNVYVATSTNAHFLSENNARRTIESGLQRLIVSLDGADEETYKIYRKGGDFNKVLEGIRTLTRLKKEMKSATPHIILQFIVFKTNEHQIEDILKLGEELGVDEVQLKSAQVYDYENGNDLIPENQKYNRYRKLPDGRYEIKNDFKNQCWRMWHSCVITWDGKMVPCCFDKDATHRMGSLESRSFKEVWHGAEYRKFRQHIFTDRKGIDICRNCTEGMTRE